MTERGRPSGFSFDDLPFGEDLTRGWAMLREEGEVVACPDQFVLSSAEGCEFAAKRPEVFSSAKAFDRVGSPVPMVPIAIDPPDHTRFRRLLDPFFSPKKMAEREPELRKQAGELIDAVKIRGECEFNADVAKPFPSQVFLTLFGLPLQDRDKLVEWKDAILHFVDRDNPEPTPEVVQKSLELYTYLSDDIAQRRRDSSGGDLLTELVNLRDDGGLTDPELLGLCFLFVFGGLDTVTSTLGFAFARLASDVDLRRRITHDYSLIPRFIEEQLRLEGPVAYVPRVVTQDVELAGTLIPEGTATLLSWGSANRDPQRYNDADDMNLDEHRPPHFAFGRGVHRCLGSHLARLELRIVLEEWHNRIPDYRLADGADPKVLWPHGTLGLESVPLVVQ